MRVLFAFLLCRDLRATLQWIGELMRRKTNDRRERKMALLINATVAPLLHN
jgi:hypothetical protein